jgi:hypothetical protein
MVEGNSRIFIWRLRDHGELMCYFITKMYPLTVALRQWLYWPVQIWANMSSKSYCQLRDCVPLICYIFAVYLIPETKGLLQRNGYQLKKELARGLRLYVTWNCRHGCLFHSLRIPHTFRMHNIARMHSRGRSFFPRERSLITHARILS